MPEKLNWTPWMYGLGAALIGGGAAAIGSAGSQVILDPQHSNPGRLLAGMGISFIISGLISASLYLKQSPLPPLIEVENIQQKIKPTADGGVVISTTKETTTEPVKSPTEGK